MVSEIYTPNQVQHQLNHQGLIGDLCDQIGAHLPHYRQIKSLLLLAGLRPRRSRT